MLETKNADTLPKRRIFERLQNIRKYVEIEIQNRFYRPNCEERLVCMICVTANGPQQRRTAPMRQHNVYGCRSTIPSASLVYRDSAHKTTRPLKIYAYKISRKRTQSLKPIIYKSQCLCIRASLDVYKSNKVKHFQSNQALLTIKMVRREKILASIKELIVKLKNEGKSLAKFQKLLCVMSQNNFILLLSRPI